MMRRRFEFRTVLRATCGAAAALFFGGGGYGQHPDADSAATFAFAASTAAAPRVFLPRDDARARVLRTARYADLEADYGAFLLFRVDPTAAAEDPAWRADPPPLRSTEIPLQGRSLFGEAPEAFLAGLAPAERFAPGAPPGAPPDPGAGLYLLQFVGPLHADWEPVFAALGDGFRQSIPHDAFVVAIDPAHAALLPVVAALPFVRYVGAFEPGCRLDADLRDAALHGDASPRPVVVVLTHPAPEAASGAIEAVRDAGVDEERAYGVGGLTYVRISLSPREALKLARRPDVLAIEPRGILRRRDERQGRTLSGHVGAKGPTAPGYLAWLATRGFGAGQFTDFSINIVDDARSLLGHPDLAASRVHFQHNPTGQGVSQAGHGFLNAHIAAGYNDQTGAAFEDSAGFNYGLGVAPWAAVGATAIFGPGSGAPVEWEDDAYRVSARISNNSWGYVTAAGGPVAKYESSAREFDVIVRDARPNTAGRQELAVIFAAGNDGAAPNTVGAPATAKNVLCVGASENRRNTGTDGCGVGNSGADDVDDLIAFSSRGPVNAAAGDGRFKPDVVAPGTHVQAGVPQSNYVGGGVCDTYWPAGQTLYGWSSGTSHSAPAVAGAAALLRQRRVNQGRGAPSPALTRAWLANSATHLVGVGANDTLPSPGQGMGRVDLGRGLDDAERLIVDQGVVLGATGATHAVAGTVDDPALPVRVTLAWTDAPGGLTGAPWVNDLDLTVQVGGAVYRGNVFSGARSIAGGAPDGKNNLESVFLPAGTTGPITVTVSAANIAGDGVPGDADKSDQDFALVVYNVAANVPPVASFATDVLAGPAPLVVHFTETTTGAATSRVWDFGDGTQSSAANPVKTYSAPGAYAVTLTATGPYGVSVATGMIDVRPRLLYVSFADSVNLPGLGTVDDEDVVVYDSAAGTWSMHFDGSDVGLGSADVRGVAFLPGGDVVLTFSAATNVVGLTGGPNGALVTPRQAVRFTPTSTGAATAGGFSFYFDGEDVGLTTTGEALDAFQIGGDGKIYVSTSGNPSVTGLAGLGDEDVLVFTPTALGAATAGTWALHFDASGVAIGDAAGEDLDAVAFDPQGRLYFSTSSSFSGGGAAGADEDVARFSGTFGVGTAGAVALVFDFSALGLPSGSDVDGLSFGP